MRIFLIILLAATLGGCATRGPINIACNGFESEYRKDLLPSQLEQAIHGGSEAGLVDRGQDDLAQRLETVLARRGESAGLSEPRPQAILLLSGGGQWGAFGASYLAELHAQGSLPDFPIITGVSTGGLQSLFVAIGDDLAYRKLVASYSPRDEGAVVDRNAKALAAIKGSMAGLKPLKARIENALCADLGQPCMLDRLADLEGKKAVLIGFVGATSGKFHYVDAVEVAAQPDRRNARDCLVGAALASAGMPVFFQQVQINDRTYYDGGVRQSVFETAVAEASVAALDEDERLPVYVLRNGPTRLIPIELDAQGLSTADRNGDALTAAERAETILVNETEVRSIAALRLQNPTGTLRMVSANGWRTLGKCIKRPEMMFDPIFMACLRDYGAAAAARPQDGWIELPPIDPEHRPED